MVNQPAAEGEPEDFDLWALVDFGHLYPLARLDSYLFFPLMLITREYTTLLFTPPQNFQLVIQIFDKRIANTA